VWPYLAGFAIFLAALAAGLFFITPWAPLFVLLSLGVQAPVVLLITATSLNGGYRDRAFERRGQYEKDGDADAWLAAEAREALSVGYRYFSSGTKSHSALNRAQALAALGRYDEGAALLAEVDEKKLDHLSKRRFDAAVEAVRGRVRQVKNPR
jgi:hypothetical protein